MFKRLFGGKKDLEKEKQEQAAKIAQVTIESSKKDDKKPESTKVEPKKIVEQQQPSKTVVEQSTKDESKKKPDIKKPDIKKSEVEKKVELKEETKEDILPDKNALSLKQKNSDILEKKLANRPTAVESGVNTSVAASLQSRVKEIESAKKRDSLSQQMRDRPNAEDIGIDTKVAASLQARVKSLENQQRRLSISGLLKTRPDAQDLIDQNILKPYANKLANALQMNADQLEQLLALRIDKKFLKEKNIISPKGDIAKGFEYTIDKSSITEEKEFEETSAQLLKFLMRRPSKQLAMDEIGLSNINNDKIAPNLQANTKEMEMELKKQELSKSLKNKPSNIDNIGIMSNNIAASLQGTILSLGRQIIRDKLSKQLKDRRNSLDLTNVVVDSGKIAPKLQATVKVLENKQRRKSISDKLNARPEQQDLIDLGILKPYVNKLANNLQMNADQLEKLLVLRCDEQYLKKIGILEPQTSKTIDNTSIIDDEKMEETSAKLLELLVMRPSKSVAMKESGSIENKNVSSVIQSNIKTLEMEMNKDKLKKGLERRDSIDVKKLNINMKIDGSLQQTLMKLSTQFLKDELNAFLRQKLRYQSYTDNIRNILTSIDHLIKFIDE